MKRRMPDTTIKCSICEGTGVSLYLHPHECGACFGSGLSTAYYDQRRNGTTITLLVGETLASHLRDEGRNPIYRNGKLIGYHVLVTWENLSYRGA